MRIKVIEEKYKCDKCGHEWTGRGRRDPSVCPNSSCHTALWNESGQIQDLTKNIEETFEMDNVALNKFTHDYGMPLEHYLRYNK